MQQQIGEVTESSYNNISIKIEDDKDFEKHKNELQIGRYLKIQEGNHDFVLAVIHSIKVINMENELNNHYIINTQPIGTLMQSEEVSLGFKQGSVSLPSPTEKAYLVEEKEYNSIFKSDKQTFELGTLIQNKNIKLHLDGNKFFGKHIAIVGSTGSGKSNTVAKILQDVVGIKDSKNIFKSEQKNSHIIIFDIHSEYHSAFNISEEENFNLNHLDVQKLKLPYWLMNSEELETLFIESNEQNSHNQVSQFKKAVILNKEKYNSHLGIKITYDTPVYFNITEVFNYLTNINNEVYARNHNEPFKPKLFDGNHIDDKNEYFIEIKKFAEPSSKKDDNTSNGPFNGEFDRFLSRLETKINDNRLDFLQLKQNNHTTEEFETILKQFIGYLTYSNISIIDLSGVPFEVLSITTSLISRLIFDFSFHYSKLKHNSSQTNDVPFMIVCEEAHNYIPRSERAEYKTSKKSIERIAKEGRKYGLSLMVVSQRPSEVSDTIFSQCNNFVSMRLTNVQDQNYVKSLLSDNSSSITDTLPTLTAGECLIVGDATPLPSIVKLDKPNPEPQSQNVDVHNKWKEKWVEINFEDVIHIWRNQSK
ncbi:ATP-binding protein [Salibacterium sp. K-3]